MQDSAFTFNPIDGFRYVRVDRTIESTWRTSVTTKVADYVWRAWSGERASWRKAKKRNAACEVSVRGRRNKSVRPCRRSRPCVDTVSPSCRPIFFSSLPTPLDVSCGIDPKTNGTKRVDFARGRSENGEKVRERMREK